MSDTTQKIQRIGRQQLIEFTQGCLRARSINGLVEELIKNIVPACDMEPQRLSSSAGTQRQSARLLACF